MLIQPNELTGLIRVLKYYAFFRYAATADDIYITYPCKISLRHMELILQSAVAEKKVLTQNIAGTSYYTLPPQGISLHEVEKKVALTREKISAAKLFLWAAEYHTVVHLIGLTGSLAMKNARKNDDVDFFIISAPHRVWTARALLLLTAALLGMRRKRNDASPAGKICMNLFFDGTDLVVPRHKQTLYVAHEIVQMKPQFVKNNTYAQFLHENRWIDAYFPNARKVLASQLRAPAHFRSRTVTQSSGLIGNLFEKLFKKLQQKIMEKHRTNELVSNTQMWFYPDDFEEKLRKGSIIS